MQTSEDSAKLALAFVLEQPGAGLLDIEMVLAVPRLQGDKQSGRSWIGARSSHTRRLGGIPPSGAV